MRDDLSIRAGLILLLLLVLRPASAAGASVDKVGVRDGTLLLGQIKRVEGGKLILDTDYASDIAIDVGHIVSVESDQQFSVRLISGEIINGTLTVSEGKIVLREDLAASGDFKAEELPREMDMADTASKALPTTSDPAGEVLDAAPESGIDELEPEPLPTAEAALPETAPDDRQRSDTTAEIAKTEQDEPSDSGAAAEPPETRTFSFDDVDWIREKPSYLRYSADVNVGAQLARGNTDTTDLHFDAHFRPSIGWNTFRLEGEYDKKRADGDTTTNRWIASAAYERHIRRRWYYSASNSYESDRQRDLDLRIIAGTGIGYHVFDQAPTFLSVLPGLAYVNENFAGSMNDTDYVAFQWKLDFARDLYHDDIRFFHNHMYLNNLQDLNDIIIETRTGFKFDMPWDLVLSAEFQSDWDNEPADNTKKLDTRYMLTIGFAFKGDETDWFQ